MEIIDKGRESEPIQHQPAGQWRRRNGRWRAASLARTMAVPPTAKDLVQSSLSRELASVAEQENAWGRLIQQHQSHLSSTVEVRTTGCKNLIPIPTVDLSQVDPRRDWEAFAAESRRALQSIDWPSDQSEVGIQELRRCSDLGAST